MVDAGQYLHSELKKGLEALPPSQASGALKLASHYEIGH